LSRPRKVTSGLQKSLRPLSATYRRKVRALYTGPRSGFRDEDRDRLAACVWRVMDELEHRTPQHPQVAALRATMHVLQCDSGASEEISSIPRRTAAGGYERVPARWPEAEAARALIGRKRRCAMTPEQKAAAAARLARARERGEVAP
jgi:hypothetical protein